MIVFEENYCITALRICQETTGYQILQPNHPDVFLSQQQPSKLCPFFTNREIRHPNAMQSHRYIASSI